MRDRRSAAVRGQLGDGGFQECTGLEIEMDVQELQEGGRNDGTVRLVGRGKYTNIVLKRGMLYPAGGTAVNEIWDGCRASSRDSGRWCATTA